MSLDADVATSAGNFELSVRLCAPAGSVVAVLGPNGAGKSTLLRVLAGLTALQAGIVSLDGHILDDPAAGIFVPPEQRGVGVVFQDYLLFDHLSVLENIAFGPRSAGIGKAAARTIAASWLERVGLSDRSSAKPRQLSGGQAQRVALARALATDPQLLLLDEPLAALDVGTRADVRRHLRRHLQQFAGTTVLVTHDPLDALVLADQIVVIEAGRVSQAGPIAEVTSRPRSAYVAQLIGTNLLRGEANGHDLHVTEAHLTIADHHVGPAFATISPSAVALHRHAPSGSPRNQWLAKITSIDLLGDRVRVTLAGTLDVVAEITPGAAAELDLREGDDVWAAVKATEINVYDMGRA